MCDRQSKRTCFDQQLQKKFGQIVENYNSANKLTFKLLSDLPNRVNSITFNAGGSHSSMAYGTLTNENRIFTIDTHGYNYEVFIWINFDTSNIGEYSYYLDSQSLFWNKDNPNVVNVNHQPNYNRMDRSINLDNGVLYNPIYTAHPTKGNTKVGALCTTFTLYGDNNVSIDFNNCI